jgi:hypothetical protein
MNETFLIILLLLMVGTVAKVIFGAIRKKKPAETK